MQKFSDWNMNRSIIGLELYLLSTSDIIQITCRAISCNWFEEAQFTLSGWHFWKNICSQDDRGF
jgi:hypothetical protein